jgi:preprotein translocase subunit SecG
MFFSFAFTINIVMATQDSYGKRFTIVTVVFAALAILFGHLYSRSKKSAKIEADAEPCCAPEPSDAPNSKPAPAKTQQEITERPHP